MTNFSLFGLYFGRKCSHFLSKQRYQINSAQLLIFERLKLEKKQSGKEWRGCMCFLFSCPIGGKMKLA